MRLLLEPTPESGGGNPAAPATPDYAAELAKHRGDQSALAMALLGENATLRQAADKLKADYAEARRKIPAEGSRVLAAEDAARFDAWSALGDPADVKKRLDAGDEAAGKVKAHDRRRLIEQAAAAQGWDPDVLEHLAGPDLQIDLKDVTRNGKPAKSAEVVLTTQEGGKERVERVALDKHAEKAWPKFAASLKAGTAPRDPGTPGYDTIRFSQPPAPPAAEQPFVNIA
jgi:hypothetical protein